MRKLCSLVMSLCLALCFNFMYAQDATVQSLSIEEMFDLAEQNNSRIKVGITAVKEAQENVRVAENAYLPSIEASLSLSYNGDGLIMDRNFGNAFKAEIPSFGNNFNYWGIGVGISYNFDRLYKSSKNIRADRLGVQKANEEMEVVKEQIFLAMQAAHIKYQEAYTLLETKKKAWSWQVRITR